MIGYTESELELLLDDSVSDLVERKQSFRADTPGMARQTVCAFANDMPNHNRPGVLIIGVRDDGTPSGEPITDELLRNLSDMKTDGNILPLPALTVERKFLKGAEMPS
jgi:ATP-dependent DNA helicase RecG